jgi:hypothetical protein
MLSAFPGMSACAVGSDIYVSAENELSQSVYKYDTEANVWSIMQPMPLACCWASAIVLDNLVYIVNAGVDTDLLCFDPASNDWSMLARPLHNREFGADFVTGGCLHAAGGFGSGSGASVERYDVASNTWTVVSSMLVGRRAFKCVTIEAIGLAKEKNLFDSLIVEASRFTA